MLLVGSLGAGKKDASPHVLGAAQLEILRFYCEHGEHGSTPPCENFAVMKAVKLGTRKPRDLARQVLRRGRRRPRRAGALADALLLLLRLEEAGDGERRLLRRHEVA